MTILHYSRLRKGRLESRRLRVRRGALARADIIMGWMGFSRVRGGGHP